jgi:glycosyltransferase involved in cell wall biosynthesis
MRQFLANLRDHGPYDVVHSHVHHFSGFVLKAASCGGVARRIAHSHNDTRHQEADAGPFRRAYLRLANRWIDHYATHRIAASREATLSLAHGDSQSWSVLYYGHDFAPFFAKPDKVALRREFGIPDDALVLGHVGRFDHQKNHGFLLRIAAEVARVRTTSRLLLVGDGRLRESIEREAAALGIADRVIFAGVRKDVPNLLLGVIDVFVFPSRHEGLPLACTEAQAAGLPLVIADTITRELDVVPGAVTRLQLTDSPAVWARRCLEAVSVARTPPAAAIAMLNASQFSIAASLSALEAIYSPA